MIRAGAMGKERLGIAEVTSTTPTFAPIRAFWQSWIVHMYIQQTQASNVYILWCFVNMSFSLDTKAEALGTPAA